MNDNEFSSDNEYYPPVPQSGILNNHQNEINQHSSFSIADGQDFNGVQENNANMITQNTLLAPRQVSYDTIQNNLQLDQPPALPQLDQPPALPQLDQPQLQHQPPNIERNIERLPPRDRNGEVITPQEQMFTRWIYSTSLATGKTNFMNQYITIFEITLAFALMVIMYSDSKPFYYLMIFPFMDNIFDYIMLIRIKIESRRGQLYFEAPENQKKEFRSQLLKQIFKTIFIIVCIIHIRNLRDNPDSKNWVIIVFIVIQFCQECAHQKKERTDILKFHEAFTTIFLHGQLISITIALSNVIEKYNWNMILIPQIIFGGICSFICFVPIITFICDIFLLLCTCSKFTDNAKKNALYLAFCGYGFPQFFQILYSAEKLNQLTNNKYDIKRSETSFDIAKGFSIAFFIAIILRWVVLHTITTNKHPNDVVVDQPVPVVGANGTVAQPQIELRAASLLRPVQQPAVQNESKWEKFQSFLPIGPNYFVKNPTEKQKSDFMKKNFSEDEKMCKICYVDESNTIVNVCGHGGMCSGCARKVATKMKTCMMCRKKIDKILVIKFLVDNPGHVEVMEVIKV